MPCFDLQAHSIYSDGELAPADVVKTASQSGISLFALTDHDTVEGVGEALQAGVTYGVKIISAVELSTVHADHEDLHILGYCIDHTDPFLLKQLDDYRADRAQRGWQIVQRLEQLGFAVDRSELNRRHEQNLPIGRPHIAQAVVTHPDNSARLTAESISDISAFFPPYLVPEGAAYVSRTYPTVEQAIHLIHRVGGVAVWAHPFWDIEFNEEVATMVGQFNEWGLDGMEVFYPTHKREQTGFLVKLCESNKLLMTGSADFHGPSHRIFAKMGIFQTYGHSPQLGPLNRIV